MDEFEQFLQQQRLRDVPPDWRSEILDALPSPVPWWHEWFWPSPLAWAGLACVWLMIAGFNLAARPTAKEKEAARRMPRLTARELAAVLRWRERDLSQMLTPPAEQREALPGPRSDSREEERNV